MQQLAEAAPALVVAAQAVNTLWMHQQVFAQDRGAVRRFLEVVHAAADGLPVTEAEVDANLGSPQRAIETFRARRDAFGVAFEALRLDVAGLLRPEGVVAGETRGSSACAILEREAASIAMVLDAGQVPDRAAARSFRGWGELATLVECEVAALVRATPQPDKARDLAQRLRDALGEPTSAETEQVLSVLWRDDLIRNELFLRLREGEREPLTRLFENFGPGPRLTHHRGPDFKAQVRWLDQTTAMRRGAVRAALAREFGVAGAGAPEKARSKAVGGELAQELGLPERANVLLDKAADPPADSSTKGRSRVAGVPTMLQSKSLAAMVIMTLAEAGPLNRAQLKSESDTSKQQQIGNHVAPSGRLSLLGLISEDANGLIHLTKKGEVEAEGQRRAGTGLLPTSASAR